MATAQGDADAQMNSTPDAPDTPPGSAQPAFAQLSAVSGRRDTAAGMETPPPSIMPLARMDNATLLQNPGTMSSPHPGGPQEKKSMVETYSQAGWGGKKAVEEFEAQREKLLDKEFSLAWARDDFDESDMWRQ